MGFLRWTLLILIAVAVLVITLAIGARFGDGPIGPFVGGALRSGQWTSSPVTDWSFVTHPEIEMQLRADANSRHVWLINMDGRAYVPAGTSFPPNKRWHQRASDNGEAILRIENKRYAVTLKRIDAESDEFARVASHMQRTGSVPPGGTERMWLFAVVSRGR